MYTEILVIRVVYVLEKNTNLKTECSNIVLCGQNGFRDVIGKRNVIICKLLLIHMKIFAGVCYNNMVFVCNNCQCNQKT
jgi:hypothetical protein